MMMRCLICLVIIGGALSGCQEPLEQGDQGTYQRHEAALGLEDAPVDAASDAGDQASSDEEAALAARVTYGVSSPPEGNVPIKTVMPDTTRHCQNDLPGRDDAEERAAGAEPAPVAVQVYRPVVSVAPEEAPRKPSNLRGGRVLALAPSSEMASLYAAFQAEGCDLPARAAERACAQHPYNEAIRREIEDPMAALEAARAEYAAAHVRLSEAAAAESP